eukprot:4257807-Pyramimonas_sp.AAC.1
MSRAARPQYLEVDGEKLLADWAPFLTLRDPGFAWTGSDYSRSGGNQSIDKAGLMKYKQVLAPLLRAAPSGFPTQGSLRAVFVVADARYGVLGTNEKGRFN